MAALFQNVRNSECYNWHQITVLSEKSKVAHLIPKNIWHFPLWQRNEMRLLFLESSANINCNSLADPQTHAKPNQAKWSYTTPKVLAWSPTPHGPPLTAPLSQTRIQPLSPALQACVRADVRIPPPASQMCLRYRGNPDLSYGLLHPPSECVCMRVWACVLVGVTACRPRPGSEFKLTCFRAAFSCKKGPKLYGSSSEECPPPPDIQVSGSFTKGSEKLKQWNEMFPTKIKHFILQLA